MGIGNTGDNFEYCVPKIEPPKTTQDGSILFPNGTKYSPANKPIVSAPSTPPTDLPPGVKLPMPEILTPGIAAEPLLPVDTIFSQEGALVSAPLEDNLEIFSEEVLSGQSEIKNVLSGMTPVPANEITPQDLSSTLTLLRLPVTKENLALARILAEHQIPISHENIMELKIALSSFAHPEPSKYQFESAGFLKQGALPVNPKNINALANFFENNPQIGKQFQELKTVLNEFLSANISNPKAFNLFSQIPTLLGSLILNFNPEMRQKVLETLFKITRMVGIEKFQQEASLKDLFQNLKDSLKFIQGETERQVLTKVLNLFGQIEQNISAQALLNQAKLKEDILFYYFQIPFNLRDEIGMSEFKINFRSDSENKLIDPGNFELEFIVKTPKLKKIYFKLKIINNVISGKILTQNEKIARFIDKKLEILKISLQKLSYKIGHLNIQGALEDINLVSLRDFKKIKRINFSA